MDDAAEGYVDDDGEGEHHEDEHGGGCGGRGCGNVRRTVARRGVSMRMHVR